VYPPRHPVPQLASTLARAITTPRWSTIRTCSDASNTSAVPVTRTDPARWLPMAGFQTTIGGNSPAKEVRVIGRGTGTPSPVSVVTTCPFTSSTTRSTLANWVSV
jgi:hypothetical protein